MSRRESRLTLRSRLIMAGLIVLVYGIACFLPALEFVVPGVTPPRVNEWPGWAVLASGPFPLGSPSSASWCANILLLFDLLFLLRGFRWLTLISSCLTLPLGLCVFGVFSMKFFFYSTQWVLQSLPGRCLGMACQSWHDVPRRPDSLVRAHKGKRVRCVARRRSGRSL